MNNDRTDLRPPHSLILTIRGPRPYVDWCYREVSRIRCNGLPACLRVSPDGRVCVARNPEKWVEE